MYKKLTLDDMLKVQTGLFERLRALCKAHRHEYLKGFVQEFVVGTERAYFFRDNKPSLCFFTQADGSVRLVDEGESVELLLSPVDLERLHNVLKDQKTLINAKKQQTVFEDLLRQFQDQELSLFDGKPFLVYDIETLYDPRTSGQLFSMAYMIDSAKDHRDVMQYEYVDETTLRDFAEVLAAYDGRIVGFNQLSFDNPITMKQAGMEDALMIVQQKSLDPFQLVWSLTGRRMSLQAMAGALLGAGKTLSSGAEGQSLLEHWKKTGDLKALEKVKLYCKNDVEITLGVFLYFLRFQDIHLDGEHLTIDPPTFLRHGTRKLEKVEGAQTEQQSGLF